MNCPKCNAVIDDDSKFCVHCGESIDPESMPKADDKTEQAEEHAGTNEDMHQTHKTELPVNDAQAEKAKTTADTEKTVPAESMIQKVMNDKAKLAGLIIGTVLIIIGVYRIMEAGTTISSTSFGADFYTYTYQGIVAISRILASIEVTMGWVIVAIGAAIDVISLK